jgi:hypothetical protein
MTRTARVRSEPPAPGVFPATAPHAPHTPQGPRRGAQLAVHPAESFPPPAPTGSPAVPGDPPRRGSTTLCRSSPVTEAVEGASADPGTLLPGTR